MIDEKNVQETQASETQEEHIDTSSEADVEETKEESIDYAAELARLTESSQKKDTQLEQAGHTIQELKRDLKNKTSIDAEEIQRMIEEQVAERVNAVEKVALESSMDSLISQRASTEDEAKLMRWHMDNTIKSTGSLKDRVDMAYALANSSKMIEQLSEAKRALASRGTAGSGAGAGQKKQTYAKRELSPKDQSLVASAGMKWNGKTGRYEGKYTALQFNEATKNWESVKTA